MYSILLAAFGILAALPSIQAAPAAEPQTYVPPSGGNDGSGRSCDSYGFMSMGQLEVHNNYGDALQIKADYQPDGSKGLYSLGLNDREVHVPAGGFHEFDRDSNLRFLDRDRNIYLFICMYGYGCVRVPGVYRIPKPGQKQWVARVDINPKPCKLGLACAGLSSSIAPMCMVDRAMRVAWAP